MAEKSAFDYVNEILGIVNYVHDVLRPADTTGNCPSRISNGYAECANRLINGTDVRGRGYSFDTLRARSLHRRQNLDRIIASNGLTIGPRVDVLGPLFVTGPDRDDEMVDEFIGSRSGAKIDAKTGEIL